jgi:hypothetical protein
MIETVISQPGAAMLHSNLSGDFMLRSIHGRGQVPVDQFTLKYQKPL